MLINTRPSLATGVAILLRLPLADYEGHEGKL